VESLQLSYKLKMIMGMEFESIITGIFLHWKGTEFFPDLIFRCTFRVSSPGARFGINGPEAHPSSIAITRYRMSHCVSWTGK